ncbi:DUF6242 domain-containing protein [uncultured Bacteroides sp.]|uniref:DUF6242 domain-containing protein n=1 Tax=uncultured Bacteroides sp. TaxID=162156 RepID=UPI002AAAD475|nr:DUF6242 domain-containing protein [uncultured Bacteroides sp.]
MKIPFLSIIVSLFIVSLVFTSCLSSDNAVTYEIDPTIKSFSFDSIKVDATHTAIGKKYPFSIDQIGDGSTALIYNADSLPVNTKVSKVKINLNTAGGVTYFKNGKDTIYTSTDSINFTNPVNFTVYASNSDGTVTKKLYKISINVHKQDPDSLNWGKQAFFTGTGLTGKQKSLIFNNQVFVFNDDGSTQIKVTSSAVTDGKSWTALQTISGLSEKADYSSVTLFNNNLYIVAGGNVYVSANGTTWIKNSGLSDNVKSLLTSFSGHLAGIKTVGADSKFCVTTDGQTWVTGETVPSDFPTTNFSATSYALKTNASIYRAILMGDNPSLAAGDTVAVPWSTFDGKEWADLSATTGYCPKTSNISITYYNNKFYAFGGNGENGFKAFYVSEDARIWNKVGEKVCFPTSFTGRGDYSYIIDSSNFIWLIWSKTAQKNDEIWKGKINSLGFTAQ